MRPLAALLVLAALVVLAIAAAAPAQAESVIAALSSRRIEIRSNFVGTELVLFGAVERDAATVGRRSESYDVAVVVEGPARAMTVWRKERVLGVWVNGAGVEFRAAPSYYAVLSNRPLDELSSPAALRRQQIGLGQIRLEPATETTPDTLAEFREALIRREQGHALYLEAPGAVEMLTASMFMARIPLPANIQTGGYRARVHVFNDGAQVATQRLGFWVIKTDFEAAIYDLAHGKPLVYGLATVAMAFGIGWLGSILFRRT